MPMNVLELIDVVKRYENHTAVDNVSFTVPQGTIYGLLGPNGAGKTSLIRIITTITRADHGTVLLNGEKINTSTPSKIGYMPEERGLYKKMKVGDQLMYLAQLKGLTKKKAKSEIDGWMEKFDIESWWDRRVEELSKGMQQKIQFISTIMHRPNLLILDEPFSGLDPINTNLIKDEIYQLNQEGTSIIFSTHRMEQVEEICEHIVLINKGKKVLDGNVRAIKLQNKENLYRIDYEGTLPNHIGDQFKLESSSDKELLIKVAPGEDSNQLLAALIRNNVHVTSFSEVLPTLNDIFIKQVGSSDE